MFSGKRDKSHDLLDSDIFSIAEIPKVTPKRSNIFRARRRNKEKVKKKNLKKVRRNWNLERVGQTAQSMLELSVIDNH